MSELRFEMFDNEKIEEYTKEAKAAWGKTDAYKEFERKSAGRSREDERVLGNEMMDIFAEFGQIRESDPEAAEAQELVKKLQAFITEHYYTCTDQILESLGMMYAGGGDMTANIDKVGGLGTAVFANQAIEFYILNK